MVVEQFEKWVDADVLERLGVEFTRNQRRIHLCSITKQCVATTSCLRYNDDYLNSTHKFIILLMLSDRFVQLNVTNII